MSIDLHRVAGGAGASLPSDSFSAPLILARILEGTEQPGALARSLVPPAICRDVACYVSTLGEAFNSLPTTQQDQIRHHWGSHLNEILSVSRETDAELFYEALFHLGQRLEREGHMEQAGLIYSTLLPNPDSPSTTIPPSIQQQAQERIGVLNGGGSFGRQLEHMGRGFAQHALDPGLLLGASGMGLFGKGVELIGMRYLAGANFFRQSYGFARMALQFAPRATGFALEATAFPFAVNGANELLGRPVSWAHMDHRILGSWFFLGGMRVGGRLGASASRRLGVPGLRTVGSIGGIMLGHGGEVMAGFKEWHGFSNFTVEAVGTWATLQVAGRYSDYVFGGHITRMQHLMEIQSQGLARRPPSRPFSGVLDSLGEMLFPSRVAVTPEGVPIRIEGRNIPGSRAQDQIVKMVPADPPGSGNGNGSRGNGDSIPPSLSSLPPIDMTAPIEALLRGLRSGDPRLEQKNQMGAELFEHLEVVERVLRDMQRQDEVLQPDPARRLSDSDVQGALFNIRSKHFATLCDRFHHWQEKFNYLYSELQGRLANASPEEAFGLQVVVDAIEPKFLKAARYYDSATSYLEDHKGPTDRKAAFTPENYPNILSDYQRYLSEFDQFLGEKAEQYPVVREILEGFNDVPIPRYPPEKTRQEVLEDLERLQRSGVSHPHLEILSSLFHRSEIPNAASDYSSFSRYLASLMDAESFAEFQERYRPFQDYLDALGELASRLSLEEIVKLKLHPWDHPEFIQENGSVGRRSLADRIARSEVDGADALVDRYLSATQEMGRVLQRNRPAFQTSHRFSWDEVQTLLTRRGLFKTETLERLFHWAETTDGTPNNSIIYAARENAFPGMLEFLLKDSLSDADRALLVRFIDHVAERGDEGMMEMLAIRFQNYRKGGIRSRSARDNLERDLVQVAQLYGQYPGLLGPILEAYEKVNRLADALNLVSSNPEQRRKHNPLDLLAVPVQKEVLRQLAMGHQVTLLRRSGQGEAALHIVDTEGRERLLGVTSVIHPVASRSDYRNWLSDAYEELNKQHDFERPKKGGPRRYLSIRIIGVRPGVPKKDLLHWARDFLEDYSGLEEIHLFIPRKDNQVSVEGFMSDDQFKEEVVTRSAPTTEALIDNLQGDIHDYPNRYEPRIELYRLRQSLIEDGQIHPDNWPLLKTMAILFPENNVVKHELTTALKARYKEIEKKGWNLLPSAPWEESELTRDYSLTDAEVAAASRNSDRILLFPGRRQGRIVEGVFDGNVDLINTALGLDLPPERYRNFIDLKPSGFGVRQLRFEYRPKEVTFRGEISPPYTLLERLKAEWKKENELPDFQGNFYFRFGRHPQAGFLQAYFDNVVLPPDLRGWGVGTLLFKSFVDLCRDMQIPLLFAEDSNGMHAHWGWQFRGPIDQSRVQVLMDKFAREYIQSPAFQRFAWDYYQRTHQTSEVEVETVRGKGGQKLIKFDTSAIYQIENPQQAVSAYLDLDTQSLVLQDPWAIPARGRPYPGWLPQVQVGKIFMKKESILGWSSVFDTDPTSPSSVILENYLAQLLKRQYPGNPK